MNTSPQLWHRLSHLGACNVQDDQIRQKVVLTNQLSFLMLTFVAISAVVFAGTYGNNQLVYLVASLCIIPAITIALNGFKLINASRLLLGITTPLMVLFIIVLLKMYSANTAFKVSEYQYYTPRYYIMALSMLPLFLIDLRERWLFILALAVNVFCLTMFDFVHDICGVGYEAFGFHFYQYYQATVMPVVLLFFLYFSVAFYQYQNKKHEEKISHLLQKVRDMNEEISEEIQMAKGVMEGLMPGRLPEVKGLEVASYLQWSKEMGGDYYTLKRIDEDRYLVIIADVAGKGLAASIIVSTLHSYVETQLSRGDFQLSAFIASLNEVLCKITEDKFVTCWVGVYHQQKHMLESVNAGHPAPLLMNAATKEIHELKTGGTILGFFERGYRFETEVNILLPDDMLFLFTDGITEAEDVNGEMFDNNGQLRRFMVDNRELSPQKIINQLRKDVYQFAQTDHYEDDFTCMVLKRV